MQYSTSENSSQVSNINSLETFKVLDVKTNQIETLGAIDYVCGVVAAEESPSFNIEALKAQAVASFTYAVYVLNMMRSIRMQRLNTGVQISLPIHPPVHIFLKMMQESYGAITLKMTGIKYMKQ